MQLSTRTLNHAAYGLHLAYMAQDDPYSAFALELQRDLDQINAVIERRATAEHTPKERIFGQWRNR